MMTGDLSRVALDAVDTGRTRFQISTKSTLEDLLGSIPEIGILSPPLVRPLQSGFEVIAGFRRVAAARQLGKQHISVRLLPGDVTDEVCARVAVADNSLSRPLNLIEISRSLALLKETAGDTTTFHQTAAMLNLPCWHRVVEKYLGLIKLPKMIQDAVISGSISLAMGYELTRLDSAAAMKLADIFVSLGYGLNIQREILTYCREIAIRDDMALTDLLENETIHSVLNNPDFQKSRKASMIRAIIKRRRFPEITRAETTYREQEKRMKPGNNIKLIPPRDFEGQTYVARIQFRSTEALKRELISLRRISNSPELKEILGE